MLLPPGKEEAMSKPNTNCGRGFDLSPRWNDRTVIRISSAVLKRFSRSIDRQLKKLESAWGGSTARKHPLPAWAEHTAWNRKRNRLPAE